MSSVAVPFVQLTIEPAPPLAVIEKPRSVLPSPSVTTLPTPPA